jgi:hypothetical protein
MPKWTAHYASQGVTGQRDFDWFADAMNFLRETNVVPLGVSVVGGQVHSYGTIAAWFYAPGGPASTLDRALAGHTSPGSTGTSTLA